MHQNKDKTQHNKMHQNNDRAHFIGLKNFKGGRKRHSRIEKKKESNNLLESTRKISSLSKQQKNRFFKSTSQSKSRKDNHSIEAIRIKTASDFSQKIRKKNRKVISHQHSLKNIHDRLPWGINQPKLNTYVIGTLTKMHNLKQNQKQSKKEQDDEYSKSNLTIKKPDPVDRIFPLNSTTAKKTQCSGFKQLQSKISCTPEKQCISKSIYRNLEQKNEKKTTISKQIVKGYLNAFQNIENNSLLTINYRLLKTQIIELQIVVLKKIQSLYVSLKKGSLQCQSVQQKYCDINPKTSLILMIAIQGSKVDPSNYKYPELEIFMSEKAGTFGVQKHILLPYNWLYLIQPLSQKQLKQHKTNSPKKIKSKAVLDRNDFDKKFMNILFCVFRNSYYRQKNLDSKNRQICYFGLKYLGMKSIIKVTIFKKEKKFSVQCDNDGCSNPAEILKVLDSLLQL